MIALYNRPKAGKMAHALLTADVKVSLGSSAMIKAWYHKYREWQKARGRRRKHQRRFENMIKFYSQFVNEKTLCFDIGANLGNRTEVFLALGAQVVSVEPQPECMNLLQEKFGNNSKVILVEKALDSNAGEQKLYVGGASTLGSMSTEWIDQVKGSGRFSDQTWEREISVSTTTMDDLIDEYGVPDFCKIDVEGYELHVLKGLSKPIRALSFEFTPELVDVTIHCLEHLHGLGMTEFNYSLGETMELVWPEWSGISSVAKAIRSFQESTSVIGDVYARPV